jgi:hypothetical protein
LRGEHANANSSVLESDTFSRRDLLSGSIAAAITAVAAARMISSPASSQPLIREQSRRARRYAD